MKSEGIILMFVCPGIIGRLLGRFLLLRLWTTTPEKAAASAQSSAGSPGSSSGGLTVVTDLVSVTTGETTASFDVPSDFKKVERK